MREMRDEEPLQRKPEALSTPEGPRRECGMTLRAECYGATDVSLSGLEIRRSMTFCRFYEYFSRSLRPKNKNKCPQDSALLLTPIALLKNKKIPTNTK